RNGEIRQISVTPRMTKQVDTGFVYNLYREKTNFLGVIKYSAVEVRYWITSTIESLAMLIKGQFTVNDLSGPVGIIDVIGDSYEEAKSEGTVMVWMQMLYWAILLSANLGVMNLLPIPADRKSTRLNSSHVSLSYADLFSINKSTLVDRCY